MDLKYLIASLLLVGTAVNFVFGTPLEKDHEHRLRFLVLQKSDIISDDTVATTTQEGLEGQNSPEDDSVENTTPFLNLRTAAVTAKDEGVIVEEDVLVVDVKGEPSEVIVEEEPVFPKEPESDVYFNETNAEVDHKPLDISQFPELHIEGSVVRGQAACVCGKPSARIVDGVPAAIVDIPWTVGLARTGFFGFGASKKPFCGGTLINNLYVVTASHCVDGQYASGLKVWLKDEDLTNITARQVVDVAQIIMNPGYSRRTVDNDIALIKLATPISFGSDSFLVPACIPADNDNDFSNFTATVAGWGTTSSGGSQSTYLRKVDVPVMTNEVCNRDTMYKDKISENMLCAGFKEGGKDACQGDSGGPLIVRNADRETLIGIVSWGYGCAGPNSPGVYTRVGRYPQWILDNTKGAEWCAN